MMFPTSNIQTWKVYALGTWEPPKKRERNMYQSGWTEITYMWMKLRWKIASWKISLWMVAPKTLLLFFYLWLFRNDLWTTQAVITKAGSFTTFTAVKLSPIGVCCSLGWVNPAGAKFFSPSLPFAPWIRV
jgi:hypothetical protein